MPQSSFAEKEWKRHVVAYAKLTAIGTKATARQLGCSACHVRRLAAEKEAQILISEALRPHFSRLQELVGAVLTVLEEGLSAYKTNEVDHLTRLKAVERHCELMQLAQGKLRPAEPKPVSELTWEEFVPLYRARNAGRQAE